jgi:hypothetical protein
MGRMMGTKGAACPRCARANVAPAGSGDAAYCAGCGLLLGAPRHAPVLVDNRWVAGPDELAVFFGVRALSGLFVKLLRVPAASRAYILQGDTATEVPQGEYEIEGFFTRLNHLLRDGHAEILVTRTGALPVPIALDGLHSSEHLDVTARLRIGVRIENVPAFARHFMTLPGTIRTAELAELLAPPVRQLVAEFLAARSLRELAANPDTRAQLNQHLIGGLAPLLAEYGLGATRIDTLELRHDRYDEQRARIASAVLAADDERAAVAGGAAVDALYTDAEWQRIRREEEEARLRYRRAELGQESRLEQAELTLQNAERAHAIRTREIELYGRIVESRSRKEALARGAQDAVAALEHELAAKAGARGDEETQWAHLRELAAIRMRGELEVARQDAAETMAVARQRFGHQLLQQQIRNKLEQARGIEDAARQRTELARLHDEERAAADRARELAAEEHAGRLQLLKLANAAHRREAERVLEWQEAQAGAQLRAVARDEDIDAEGVRQRLETMRRDGATQDALAQHEKLLRTIAADTHQAREAQLVQIEAEQARAALAGAEREAAWQHELALARLDITRTETLGGMDDTAKLALAPHANAALLADVMRARVHAGMSADQLQALAAVAGAPNMAPADALALARDEVERERARIDVQAERERRHQLDLLALQNDVNKAALATQAQVASSLAGAVGTTAGAVAGAAVAASRAAAPAAPAAVASAAACDHGLARQGDRYCGACGAPLPARG